MNTQTATETGQTATTPTPNVQRAVPFLWVTSMEASLRFYVDGIGFTRTNQWIVDNKIRWCWLQLEGAAIMLQEYLPNRIPANKLGEGVSVCFQCRDAIALYHGFLSRNLTPKTPFVGNNMWVVQICDPDGYKLDFESPTDAPEESIYSDSKE
jgi:hypothetical protein